MYKYFVLIIIFFSVITYAQISKSTESVKEEYPKSYPIAGSDLLRDDELRVAQFLKNNPDYLNKVKLMKTTAWNFTVGSTKSWTAVDFTNNNTEYSVPSTCRAVGTNCYIFVEDNIWDIRVDQNAVDEVANAFDNSTPANSNKGIYQTVVEAFGNPPDVDSDPKIIILILDIKDGYSGSGGYIAGYFSSANEIRSEGAAEIYFMDANPTNLNSSGGLSAAASTAAHEFQHMINWNYHKTQPEITFVNEGLSMVAEIVCGYDASLQSLYANEPNHYLFDWRTNNNTLVLNDYARAQRFFLYLMEQLGVGSLKQFVQSFENHGSSGIAGLSYILANNYATSLGKVFLNFTIANGLNNISTNPAHGYTYQPIPVSVGMTFYNPNINPTSSTVQRLGVEYFTFINSSNLNVIFSGSDIIVKAIEIGETSHRVVDVPLNSSFTEPDYPSVYHTLRFAAIDTTQFANQNYQYQASGTANSSAMELKWDNTEPIGFLELTAGDSLAVVFEGVTGAKLDSIKVAVRNLVPVPGGIYELGTTSFSGKKLADFTATSTLSEPPAVVNPGGTYPYEQPYKNWVNVDLSSSSISADNDFAVVIPVEGQYPDKNRVMVTTYESSSSYNSFWYRSSSQDWVYYGVQDQEGFIFLNLIRAYVSLPTGIEQDAELAPDTYSLSQNYPNPFNPSTTIEYQIAQDGFVTLRVYDVLGREVKTLVDEFKNKGKYYVILNADGLTSGIYFYKLQAGNISETKKITLIK